MIFRDYHIEGQRQNIKIERRIGQRFAFGFHFELVGRDRDHMDFLASEGRHFLEFVDEGAVIDVFHVEGKLYHGYAAHDSCQSRGLGYCHQRPIDRRW